MLDEQIKNYHTTNIVVKKNQTDLLKYCEDSTKQAKLFKNAVIYRCRQLYIARLKNYNNLTEHEIKVLNEFDKIKVDCRYKSHGIPSYEDFDKMFKNSNNPDYYNDLASQITQNIIKDVLYNFKAYFESLKLFNKNKSKFNGKPKIPCYVKGDKTTLTISNQDAVIYQYDKLSKNKIKKLKQKNRFYKNGCFLKLPKTNCKVHLGDLKINNLIEVIIQPFYDTYKICIVDNIEPISYTKLNENCIIGIDLGVKNFVSVSNNCGLTPFVINGNGLKVYNQYYNKIIANLKSQLAVNQYNSRKIQMINRKRYHKIKDFYNKIASYLVQYCLINNIGTIIIGKNYQWKNKINIGKENNQHFCYIAHSEFINKLQEQAAKYGINVIINEESYTSKASFLDDDIIPVYGECDAPEFSGKRIKRGLYQSKNGTLINADINGASNIIKKVIKNAFDDIKDFDYLTTTVNSINMW